MLPDAGISHLTKASACRASHDIGAGSPSKPQRMAELRLIGRGQVGLSFSRSKRTVRDVLEYLRFRRETNLRPGNRGWATNAWAARRFRPLARLLFWQSRLDALDAVNTHPRTLVMLRRTALLRLPVVCANRPYFPGAP